MLRKKAGILEQKYMSHGKKECTGHPNNRTIKDGMEGYVGSRDYTEKKYKKS